MKISRQGFNFEWHLKIRPFYWQTRWYYISNNKDTGYLLWSLAVGYTYFVIELSEGYIFQLALLQRVTGIQRFKGLCWRRVIKDASINYSGNETE